MRCKKSEFFCLTLEEKFALLFPFYMIETQNWNVRLTTKAFLKKWKTIFLESGAFSDKHFFKILQVYNFFAIYDIRMRFFLKRPGYWIYVVV